MLPVELDVVWSEKLRPLNVLYIIQRYMPFVDTIGIVSLTVIFVKPIEPDTCRILYTASGWMYVTGIALTEVVLTMRTWALWGKDIRLTVGLTIFFVGCWVTLTVQATKGSLNVHSPLPRSPFSHPTDWMYDTGRSTSIILVLGDLDVLRSSDPDTDVDPWPGLFPLRKLVSVDYSSVPRWYHLLLVSFRAVSDKFGHRSTTAA
ncbi:hypothetical protein BDP27DRAFT_945495 [Rhodocollybia butyracea]|uniref:Uncharacterized protein n=1 Tax=Rhodocollybia butyracea TaxID=206335 RepID=A0A9P5U5I4_9AGAR|nr:hypothetical protein BDP27DRAFT_945495 [Rhodocollybia butyracea]